MKQQKDTKKDYKKDHLEDYRTLLDTPDKFEDGFSWTTVLGILFCGLVIMPGGIYLALMTGAQLNSAAAWVTVILFMEVARRAMKPMGKQNLVILLHAAHIIMAGHIMFPGGPMGQLVYRAYLVGSDVVRDAGMLGAFPQWWAPAFDSPAITERNFFHKDWIIPVAIMLFVTVITFIEKYTLAYFFFRLTSDVEKLPYPLAPVSAQGAMALSESDEKEEEKPTSLDEQPTEEKKKKTSRWRFFSLGAYLGIGYGFIQVGIPAITGLFLSKPFFLIPQPFIDTTTLTETILPATPTGMTLDLGLIIMGAVLPFWAVVGTFSAIVLTAIINQFLYHADLLTTWQPGMDTVNTTFANNIDFWLSFTIGVGLGIAVASVIATLRRFIISIRKFRKNKIQNKPNEDMWATPQGRGDYPVWLSLTIYVVSSIALISLSWILIPKSWGILFFLIFFAFVYSPLITYMNARLLGIAGQQIQIPHIKEASFLLSGAKGVEIWLAPIPINNLGMQAQQFRVNELTGVTFWSLIKTDLVAIPVLFILSTVFWGFIWHSDPIPSEVFPTAQVKWELHAKNQALLYSSTFIAPGDDPDSKTMMDSQFMKAMHPAVMGIGFFGIIAAYGVFAWLGIPLMFLFGMVRGFGQFPHIFLLEVIGTILGRYYFQKKYGAKTFLRTAPTILAGYFTGMGLIGMATMAMRLIKASVTSAPF